MEPRSQASAFMCMKVCPKSPEELAVISEAETSKTEGIHQKKSEREGEEGQIPLGCLENMLIHTVMEGQIECISLRLGQLLSKRMLCG